MAETTTIRLPPKLRARIHALAKQSGRSAHSFILEAVERHADYEEQMRSLVKEALAADEEIERYLRAEQPYDCAGSAKSEGLGIALLESIDSDDPTALIGLPLIRTCRLLRLAGVAGLP